MVEIDSASNRKLLAIIAATLLIGYAIYSSGLLKQSIAPGFQGISAGVSGFQVGQNPTVALGDSLPTRSGACSYGWNNYASSGFSIQVKHDTASSLSVGCYGSPATSVFYEQVQGNVIQTNPIFATPITGSYSVQVPGSNSTEQVSFKVNEYQFQINTGINAGGGGWNFGTDTSWGYITDNIWDNVGGAGGANGCDPSTASATAQCVFEAPLFMQVGCFGQSSGGTCTLPSSFNWANNNCVECTTGATVPLYSTMSAYGGPTTPGSNNAPSTSGIQSALGNAYAPDSQMQQTVYFPLSWQQMEGSCNVLSAISGCGGVQADFTMTLYTLQIGEYITNSQNPSDQKLGTNPSQTCAGIQCNLDAIGGCFSLTNLLCWGSIAALGTTAVVVLLLIFAGPTIIALFLLYQKGRRSEPDT